MLSTLQNTTCWLAPVVSDDNRLLGIVTVDDALTFLKRSTLRTYCWWWQRIPDSGDVTQHYLVPPLQPLWLLFWLLPL